MVVEATIWFIAGFGLAALGYWLHDIMEVLSKKGK